MREISNPEFLPEGPQEPVFGASADEGKSMRTRMLGRSAMEGSNRPEVAPRAAERASLGELPRAGEPLERHPEVAEPLRQGLEHTRAGIERWNEQDQARAEHWFGSSSPEVREHLRGTFERIDGAKSEVRLRPFGPELTNEERANTFAYVEPYLHVQGQEYDVHVGELYSEADGPPDSQSGVIVHELSHFYDLGATEDFEDDYGHDGARRVADRSVTDALYTGDNIEYFYEEYEQEARRAR